MTSRLVDPRQADARQFYPTDHEDDFALVFKPREFTPQNAYGKPEMLCSLAIFKNEEDLLDRGRPSEVIGSVIVSSGRIVRALQRVLQVPGGLLSGYIGQGDPTKGYETRPWLVLPLEGVETVALELIVEQVLSEMDNADA